jgi:Fe-S-cluster containining protein
MNLVNKPDIPSQDLCKGCGWCCKYYIHTVSKNDPRGEEWLEHTLEFYRARCLDWKEDEDEYIFYVHQLCPRYDEKKGCTIYDERPKVCRVFPDGWSEHVVDHCIVMKKLFD